MLELRPYQRNCINAIYNYFSEKAGNPLCILPTATGKSVIIGHFSKEAIEYYPSTRIIIVTHVKELIEQNHKKLTDISPFAPAGIYSAGLNQRNKNAQILFCGIQSVYDKAYDLQKCDILIIDEAHLIPRKSDTMYGRFIQDLRTINPDMKVIGFTATAYRLDSGSLHKGKDALFTDIAYDYSIKDAIRDGWVCTIVPKSTALKLDVQDVKKRGGEFIESQLQEAVNIDAITKKAVAEIVEYARKDNRKSWLLFCSGVDHSIAVRDEIRTHGIICETVLGNTPDQERDAILRDFKSGTITCVTNNAVLTTGFDNPHIDLIGALRPTASPVLWVQMCGRGMRLSPQKKDCLILDFSENTKRFGPLDEIKSKEKEEKDFGIPPMKDCPQCFNILYAGTRRCSCGYVFPEPELKIHSTASTLALLSTKEPPEEKVADRVSYSIHKKDGKPDSLKVTYFCGFEKFSEWICFEHSGYAWQKAVKWWTQRTSNEKAPTTTEDALKKAELLPCPYSITIQKTGKYFEIIGYKFQIPPIEEKKLDPPPNQQIQHEWYEHDIPVF